MKNETKISFSMDELLGHYKLEIEAFFGRPMLEFGVFSLYGRPAGVVTIIYQMEKVTAYAAYSANGSLACAAGVTPITLTTEQVASSGRTMAEFARDHGNPHMDLGSGSSIPAYLSDHGSIYWISLASGHIRSITERQFLPLPEISTLSRKMAQI